MQQLGTETDSTCKIAHVCANRPLQHQGRCCLLFWTLLAAAKRCLASAEMKEETSANNTAHAHIAADNAIPAEG